MKLRKKKKLYKRRIAKCAGEFFGCRVRTKHLHLLGPKSRNGYLYDHNGYSIRVVCYESEKEEEEKNGQKQTDLCSEADFGGMG